MLLLKDLVQRKEFPLVLVLVVSFGLYLFTIAPTVGYGDSGEFITAAYTVGILHPPAYPIYSPIAKLFTFIPISSVAWRVNFMSLFWAVLCVYLVYRVMYLLVGSSFVSAVTSLFLAFSLTFWRYANFAKGYTLNAFLLLALIYLFLLFRQSKEKKFIFYFAAVYGLAMGYHYQTMIVLLPVWLYFFYVTDSSFFKSKDLLKAVGIFLITAVIPYIYLVLHAVSGPSFYLSNPVNWKNFWRTILMKDYAWEFARFSSAHFGHILGQTKVFGKLLADQFFWGGLLLGLAGMVTLAKKDKFIFRFLLAGYLFLTLSVLVLTNLPLDFFNQVVVEGFFLPSHLFFVIFIGYGLWYVLGLVKEEGKRKLVIAGVLILLVLPLIFNFPKADRHSYFYAYDYAGNVLNTLPSDTLLLTDGENDTFPLVYLQKVEKVRLDVEIISIRMLALDWYRAKLRKEGKIVLSPSIESMDNVFSMALSLVQSNADKRSVYLSYPAGSQLLEKIPLTYEGIVYVYGRPSDLGKFETLLYQTYNLRGIYSKSHKNEYIVSMLAPYAHAHNILGVMYANKKDWENAEREFKNVLAVNLGSSEVLQQEFYGKTHYQLAVIYAKQDKDEQALGHLKEAFRLLPNNLAVQLALGDIYFKLGRYLAAQQVYTAIITVNPRLSLIHVRLAMIAEKNGDYPSALLHYEEELKINPNSGAALSGITRIKTLLKK